MAETTDEAIIRIAEIDRMFEDATGWGSWMVMCANERECLVDMLRGRGITVAHKWRARTAEGDRTS